MPANRPNLLFIMPDQLRPDFLSCYGASFIHTPQRTISVARSVSSISNPTHPASSTEVDEDKTEEVLLSP